MRREIWYDVSKYECWVQSPSRRLKSPLDLLRFLTDDEVDTPNARNFFSWPVFLTWNYVKLSLNLPWLIMWCIWRIGITVTTYAVSPTLFPSEIQSKGNNTDRCDEIYKASLSFSIFLMVYATLIIVLDLLEWFQYLRRDHLTLREALQFKEYATHQGLYRFVTLIQLQIKEP